MVFLCPWCWHYWISAGRCYCLSQTGPTGRQWGQRDERDHGRGACEWVCRQEREGGHDVIILQSQKNNSFNKLIRRLQPLCLSPLFPFTLRWTALLHRECSAITLSSQQTHCHTEGQPSGSHGSKLVWPPFRLFISSFLSQQQKSNTQDILLTLVEYSRSTHTFIQLGKLIHTTEQACHTD